MDTNRNDRHFEATEDGLNPADCVSYRLRRAARMAAKSFDAALKPVGLRNTQFTLLAALETYDLKRGVASLCIGGGEATAIAVERIQ